MLDLRVTVKGDKVLINGLKRLARNIPDAIQRGMKRIVRGVYASAMEFLDGPGAKASDVAAGGYPVPVRTGHLKRSLDWLEPGESKSAGGETFTAGKFEAMVYDSAEYSRIIHEGRGSSAKYGERPFITDALEDFDRATGIAEVIEEEIDRESRSSIR